MRLKNKIQIRGVPCRLLGAVLYGLLVSLSGLNAQQHLEMRVSEGEKPQILSLAKGEEASKVFANGLQVHWNIRDHHSVELLEVVYENRGQKELKLEWALVQQFDQQRYKQYWDGTSDVRGLSEIEGNYEQSNIRRMAPWTAVFADKEGIGIGLDPLELKSFVASRLVESNGKRALEFATRVVVNPGETGKVRFFRTHFPVNFGGMQELTQRVHDSFPEAFNPYPKSAQVYYGTSAQYMMSRVRPESIPGSSPIEHMRRVFATWDWSYAPFKRTGDHWGEEELWDYEPNMPFKDVQATIVQNSFHFDQVTREEFLNMREEHFNRWGQLHGLMFYSAGGVWVEKNLALEKFSDALIEDPAYRYDKIQWVTTWDREVKVFPWYTSYEPFLKENFKKIVENYDTSGVALDVARGGPKYRGPIANEPVEGRAWDEHGNYIDQGIGVARFIDYLHTLPVRYDPEKVLAVIGNPEVGGQTYTVTTRYDSGMYEGPPYHPRRQAIPLARYVLGKKPLTWWAGWMYHRYAVPNWEMYDGAHFEKTMSGLVDYVIFSSFEWAGIPSANYLWGIPKLKRLMPDILQCVRDGWQAVFPVRFNREGWEHLHVARYGNDVGTTLFWGNPYNESSPMEVAVDGGYLGENRTYLLVDWLTGKELEQRSRGVQTGVHFELLAREPVLHKVALAIDAQEGDLRFVTSAERNFETIERHIAFKEKLAVSTTGYIPQIPNYDLQEIVVDGKKLQIEEGSIVKLPEGTKEIQVRYHRQYLRSSLADILEANHFEASGKPLINISVEGVDERNQELLEIRLNQYFAYFQNVAFKGKGPYRYKGPTATQSELIQVRVSKDEAPGIYRLSDHSTRIQAESVEQAGQVLDTFLAALDTKYPYLHPMFGTWGTHHGVLVHYGYLNGYLPDSLEAEKEEGK